MAGKINPSRTACVVALLPAGAEVKKGSGAFFSSKATSAPQCDVTEKKKAPDPFFTRVGSGYEAAAELLSGPVSALLVDLGMLQAEHASLLKLAAGLDVPVVAFGTLSAAFDGEALAGVRLVGAEEVPEALREVTGIKGTDTLIEETDTSVAEREPIKVSVPLIATEEKKAPDPFFTKPLTSDELDALLRD